MIEDKLMAEKKGRVLCVDDEPNILRSLQWLLQKDFEVTTAPSGQDALAIVKCNDFDVIISDQRMPGMMGSEFLREARKLSPRSMRILLTGYSDMQAILRSVNDSEVFRFISKPWDVNQLPKVVAQAAEIARAHAVPSDALDEDAEPASDASSASVVMALDDDPAVAVSLGQTLGPTRRIIHARNRAEAMCAIRDNNVGIIVADTQVGKLDTTVLLKVLKEERPDIVTVVYTEAVDAVNVASLINYAQIFRFLPKPVKPITLKLALRAALLKRKQLRANPNSAERHRVESVADDARKVLMAGIGQSAAPALATAGAAGQSSLLHRIGGSFRRLFSAA